MKAKFTDEDHKKWQACIDVYKVHERFFRDIRNDIGGHFGLEAAIHTVKNFQAGSSGHMRTDQNFTRGKGLIFFEFATEVVAVAMMVYKRPAETSEDFFGRVFTLLREGFGLAITAVQPVTQHYIRSIRSGVAQSDVRDQHRRRAPQGPPTGTSPGSQAR